MVSEYEQTNGVGGMNKVSYKYGEAKINVQGRGFRGFGWTEITDHTAEIVNKIIYERDYKCTSSKIRTEQRTKAALCWLNR